MSALLDGTNCSFSTARRHLTRNGFALAVIQQDLVRLYLQMQHVSCDTDVSTSRQLARLPRLHKAGRLDGQSFNLLFVSFGFYLVCYNMDFFHPIRSFRGFLIVDFLELSILCFCTPY